MTESLSRNSRRALGSQVHAPKGSASGPEIGPKNSYSDPLGRNLKGRERVSGRALREARAARTSNLSRRTDEPAVALMAYQARRSQRLLSSHQRRSTWHSLINVSIGPIGRCKAHRGS